MVVSTKYMDTRVLGAKMKKLLIIALSIIGLAGIASAEPYEYWVSEGTSNVKYINGDVRFKPLYAPTTSYGVVIHSTGTITTKEFWLNGAQLTPDNYMRKSHEGYAIGQSTGSLRSDLATEISNRTAGDNALGVSTAAIRADLTSEIYTRSDSDLATRLSTATLRTDLTSEALARSNADKTLGVSTGTIRTDLTAETNARATLATNVSVSTNSLRSDLTDETAARTLANTRIGVSTGTIRTDLTAETNARIAANNTIGQSTATLRTNLTTEANTRYAADVAIGVSTAALQGQITALPGHVNVKAFGAVGDGITDDTAALQAASDYCGVTKTMFMPDGQYNVYSTTDNFALITACSITGTSPKNCIIYNTGTGSTLLLQGSGYYSKWSNFQVRGTPYSQDGIVTCSTSTMGWETAYSSFESVWSKSNGRHGIVHRMAWATKYIDCQFDGNLGLGVKAQQEVGDAGGNSAVSFINCHSRWNGGTGDATNDFEKGGVKIVGDVTFTWFRGVVESNNAWGFIISSQTVLPVQQIRIDGVHFEDEPASDTDSTIGGHVFASGDWENLSIENCWVSYGARLSATGYGFYITAVSTTPVLYTSKERIFTHGNNWMAPNGAGTNIQYYKDNNYIENPLDSINRIKFTDNTVVNSSGITTTGSLFALNTDKLVLNGQRIGVSTNTPAYSLDLYNRLADGLLARFNSLSTSGFLDIASDSGSGQGSVIGFWDNTTGGRSGYIKYDYDTDVMSFRVDGSERLTLNSGGAAFISGLGISYGDTNSYKMGESLISGRKIFQINSAITGAALGSGYAVTSDTNSNVGIGMLPGPGAKLSVNGNATFSSYLESTLIYDLSDYRFFADLASGTTALLLNGSVGIGLPAGVGPAYKLDVAGTANITGATTIGGLLTFNQAMQSGGVVYLYDGNSKKKLWRVGGTGNMKVTNTDEVGMTIADGAGHAIFDSGVTVSSVTSTGNASIGGFAAIGSGNLAFKTVIVSTRTGTVEGATTTVAHGVANADKIVGWFSKCEYTAGGGIDTSYTRNAEYQYNVTHGPTNMNVLLSTTSSDQILDKKVWIVIYYVE